MYRCSWHLYYESITKEMGLRKYFLNIGKSLQRFFLKLTNNFKTHQWIWKDCMRAVKVLLNCFVGIKIKL